MLNIWRPDPLKRRKAEATQPVKLHLLQRVLRRIEDTGIKRATSVILIFMVIAVALALGISRIRVESSNIKILRPDLAIRKAFNIADEHMAGTDNLEILVDTGKADGMKDPRVLQLMEMLQKEIEIGFSGIVTNTYSIADVAKDAYQALNNNDPGMYIIPEDPNVLSQTLFLFDNADPDDRRELVTDDYRIGRISVFSESLDSIVGLKLMNAVNQFKARKMKTLRADYPDAQVIMTGMVALRMKMYYFVSQSQIISFGITLGVISILLLIALGSIKIGLLALIPNLFPIVIAAGAMGYLKIPLDIHTLLIIPIVIGIAVDDTIHFLIHFQLERQEHGDTRKAIINSHREVGQAIVFTSIVLSMGFLIFLTSKNMGFVYFGMLSAISITSAVIADLFFLPAILAKHFPSKFKQPARPDGTLKPEPATA
jgi:predicted RND superfamily exporter protein